MTTNQFTTAYQLYVSTPDIAIRDGDLDVFYGFGLPDFDPVVCRLVDVARLIGWQAQYLGGGFDLIALNEIRNLGRTRFTIID